jgi:hypothetical protein
MQSAQILCNQCVGNTSEYVIKNKKSNGQIFLVDSEMSGMSGIAMSGRDTRTHMTYLSGAQMAGVQMAGSQLSGAQFLTQAQAVSGMQYVQSGQNGNCKVINNFENVNGNVNIYT